MPSKIVKIIFDCTDCTRAFSSRIDFEKHECNAETLRTDNRCEICRKKFKTIHDLRVHCKEHPELKCEICSEVFCKPDDLAAHQEQGCEATIETPDLVESKPTFVDCHLEPETNFMQQDEPFNCEITPKVSFDSSNDDSFDGFDRNGDNSIDDSYRAEISADSAPIQAGPSHSTIRTKRRGRPSQRKNTRKPNGYENDAADRKFHCYLCDKK